MNRRKSADGYKGEDWTMFWRGIWKKEFGSSIEADFGRKNEGILVDQRMGWILDGRGTKL